MNWICSSRQRLLVQTWSRASTMSSGLVTSTTGWSMASRWVGSGLLGCSYQQACPWMGSIVPSTHCQKEVEQL